MSSHFGSGATPFDPVATPTVLPPWVLPRSGESCPFFNSPFPRLGFTSEEVERFGFWEGRLHPEDRDRIRTALASESQPSEVLTLEYRILAADGTWRWLRDRTPRPGSGERLRLPGCITDITEEREAQARLELYHRITSILDGAAGLFDAAPGILEALALAGDWDWAGLWTVDDANEHLAFRDAWMRSKQGLSAFKEKSINLTFRRGEDLLGTLWAQGRVQWLEQLPDPTDYPRGPEAVGCGFENACCFPVKVGSNVIGIFEFFGSRPRATQGSFIEVLGVLETQIGYFTERSANVESLRRSEAQFRALFEQAPEGVFLVDLDSKRVLEGNCALQSILGYTAGELRHLNLYDLVAADAQSIDLNSARALQQGHLSLGERNYRRKDGSTFPLDVTIRAIDVEMGSLACVIVQDISAKKRLEAERARLLEIIEATPDFVGMANEHGEAIYGNAAMRRLRGPDSPEARRPIMDAHPEWAAKILLTQALPTAVEQGSWRGDSAILDLEGQEIPVSQVIVAHRGEAGEVRYFSTIARDIREQKRVEANLWSILKNLHDLQYAVEESLEYSVTDREGKILEANRRFCELSGYSREELLGKSHRILKSKVHSGEFFQGMWNTIMEGRVWRGEICNRTKQGTHYWVDATIIPWLGPDGEPERFMALRKVITDRKLAEERARRREVQLEVLLQISRDLNRDLDQSVVLRKVVQAALKLTGATIGAAGVMEQGKVRFTECHREGAWHPMVAEFELGEGVPGSVIESRLPYRSTPGVALEFESSPLELDFARGACVPILDWDGRSLGCLGIQGPSSDAGITQEDEALLVGLANAASVALVNARNIAQRELHRRAMEHTQKLESLGVQAGGIAHDFNNLLSAIAGNVALAQLHEEDGQAAHYLENVNTTIQRAADLTHQLLAYAGKGRSERNHIHLHTLVGGMVKLLKVSVSKMARIHLDLPSHLPTILAVPSELQQVVMNLVINASDALGEKEGDIFLTIRLEEQLPSKLDAEGRSIPQGTYVCLEIRDTGCGMPAEVQARIFDPFFTTKSTGRGLGLSAILGILRHHNAWIQLESAPGRGTTFTLLFSAASEPAEMQEEGRMEPCWMGHGRVLLAEDEVDVRQSTANLLRRFGFEVVEARDGAEAMTLFAAGPPFQLVLTDLTMPQMDGLELARLLRRLDPEVKVVIYSGLPFELNAASLEDLSGQLRKPFKWQELNQLMKRLLAPSDEP